MPLLPPSEARRFTPGARAGGTTQIGARWLNQGGLTWLRNLIQPRSTSILKIPRKQPRPTVRWTEILWLVWLAHFRRQTRSAPRSPRSRGVDSLSGRNFMPTDFLAKRSGRSSGAALPSASRWFGSDGRSTKLTRSLGQRPVTACWQVCTGYAGCARLCVDAPCKALIQAAGTE